MMLPFVCWYRVLTFECVCVLSRAQTIVGARHQGTRTAKRTTQAPGRRTAACYLDFPSGILQARAGGGAVGARGVASAAGSHDGRAAGDPAEGTSPIWCLGVRLTDLDLDRHACVCTLCMRFFALCKECVCISFLPFDSLCAQLNEVEMALTRLRLQAESSERTSHGMSAQSLS